MKKSLSIIVLTVLVICGTGFGGTYDLGEVVYSGGSGSNSSYFAMDFDGSNYCVLEYSWESGSSVTVWDALIAIDTECADFSMDYTDFGWGILIDDFAYTGQVKYDYTGNGDETGVSYWAYFDGDNTIWSENMTGASGDYLSDGSWDSFVWTNSFGEWPNNILRNPGEATQCYSVPEPMTCLFLGIGGLVLGKVRINKK